MKNRPAEKSHFIAEHPSIWLRAGGENAEKTFIAQAPNLPERVEPGAIQLVRTEIVLGKAEDDGKSHRPRVIASGGNEWANNSVDIDNLPQKVYTD
jgi:hypothetical protein